MGAMLLYFLLLMDMLARLIVVQLAGYSTRDMEGAGQLRHGIEFVN